MEQYVISGYTPLSAMFMLKHKKTMLFITMFDDPQIAHTISEFLQIPQLLNLGTLNTHCLDILKIQNIELRILRAKLEYYEKENLKKNRMQMMMEFLGPDQNAFIQIHEGNILFDNHQRINQTVRRLKKNNKSSPYQLIKLSIASAKSNNSINTNSSKSDPKKPTISKAIKKDQKEGQKNTQSKLEQQSKKAKDDDPATIMSQIQRRNARKAMMLQKLSKEDSSENAERLKQYRQQYAKNMIIQARIYQYARMMEGKLPSQLTREEKEQIMKKKLMQKNIPFVDRIEDLQKTDIVAKKETFYDRMKRTLFRQTT